MTAKCTGQSGRRGATVGTWQTRLLQTDGGGDACSEGPQRLRPWGPGVVTQRVRFGAE